LHCNNNNNKIDYSVRNDKVTAHALQNVLYVMYVYTVQCIQMCFLRVQAAHCYIHIAALIAEYLKRRGV